MDNVYTLYSEKLKALSDPEYKRFHEKLNPGIDNIIGVRIPAVRKLAKELAREGWREYFAQNQDRYFEETMLQGLTIGNLQENAETVVSEARHFLPKLRGWALCDVFCGELKVAKKQPQIFWSFVLECAEAEDENLIRFAVVMMLSHFIDEEHIDEILMRLGGITNDGYYVRMAVAWAVSVCFVKQREKTLKFLENCPLDDYTYFKALQKIRESFRVGKEDKALMLQLKKMRHEGERPLGGNNVFNDKEAAGQRR